MDVNRLSQGEQIAGASAVLLFIFMFLTWFGVSAQGAEVNFSGWESFDYINCVLAIAIAVTVELVVLRSQGRDLGDLNVAMVITVLGVVATILVLYRVLSPPGAIAGEDLGVDLDRKIGAILGLLACAGIAVGGYLSSTGQTVSSAGDRFGGQPPSSPPPPPPAGP
jgi:hypothetical protein